jgi:DHA1 family bicyclomycin/chloramphenicol resistance-like MFS transporter
MRISPDSIAFTIFLAAFPAMASLSIDMSLPSLAGIGRDFAASPAALGLVLSLFMAGFGVAQLLFGPLSDRVGRRPSLLAGLALFLLASLGCAASSSIGSLNIWRFVQGAGAGGGMVVAFAVVRDRFEGVQARTRFAYVTAVMLVAPLVAPSIGAQVYAVAGWRAVFVLLLGAGLALLLATAFGFEESIRQTNPGALRPLRLARNYWRVLSHRIVLGYVLIRALSFGGMFAYISGSAFVFIVLLGYTPRVFGLIFAATAIGLMIGSVVAGKLAARFHRGSVVMVAGLVMSALASLAILGLSLTGTFSLPTALPLLVANFIAIGMITPNATHGALEPMADIAGMASAVLGCVQMAGGTLSSILVGLLYRGTPTAMAETMSAFAVLALLVWVGMLRERPSKQRVGSWRIL